MKRRFAKWAVEKKWHGEGTGLGLALMYNIIKKHEGDITVESLISEGTTFKVSLPVG
jgi:two-component system NtrC family sensor kinase